MLRPVPDPTDTTRPGVRTRPAVPTHLTVRAWWDPGLAHAGFDPRSPYAERFWLGVIGPSTLLLLRRFTRGLEEHPAGFRVSLADTAGALGLGGGTGRNAPVNRTIDRACTFGLARRVGDDQLEVRTHLPRLNRRQLDRLPDVVRRAHDSWLLRHAPDDADHPGAPGPRAA